MRRLLLMAILLALCVHWTTASLAEGSWGQINQEITSPAGWEKFVENSPFSLDGKRQIGDINGEAFYEIGYGTYPSIDGSTVSVPMAMEFARQHLAIDEGDLMDFVRFSTTHTAYLHLIEKKPNLGIQIPGQNMVLDETHPVDLMIGTEPSDEELQIAADAGVELVKEPVCYDAFIFITRRNNPVDNLTSQQIRDIYSGKITHWNEVGGENLPIFALQREKNSGSQTAMENLVMQGTPMASVPTELVPTEMGGLVKQVAEYKNDNLRIGYTYLFYISTLYKNDDIKVLSIDGIDPTAENLRSGAYPFTVNYFGVIRKGDEEASGGKFLSWMRSEEGQKAIRQAGYVTLEAMP